MYNGSYASQEWTLSQNNGYVQFVNRWDGSMLGDQDQNGTVERNGSAGASSSNWIVTPAAAFRIQNRWKPTEYAYESNGAVKYEALASSQAT